MWVGRDVGQAVLNLANELLIQLSPAAMPKGGGPRTALIAIPEMSTPTLAKPKVDTIAKPTQGQCRASSAGVAMPVLVIHRQHDGGMLHLHAGEQRCG